MHRAGCQPNNRKLIFTHATSDEMAPSGEIGGFYK